jgi:steroid 5-alpha reductase family enzyme
MKINRGEPMFLKMTLMLLLASSIIILQYHSVQFWIKQVGEIGILYSVAIEAMAMYFWFNKKNILAGIATILLITTPALSSLLFYCDV